MKPLFLAGIGLAVVFAAIGVYYAIGGMEHVLTSGTGHHYKHALVFFALAVISVIGGRFASNSSGVAAK